VAQTGRKSAHWCSLGAALDELGWPWLRLLAELVAGRLAYRTWPSGHVIDWLDPYLRPYLNIERSEISIPSDVVVRAINDAVAVMTGAPRPPKKRRSELEGKTIAIEVLLPVGQRPSTALIKASWRDRVPEADIEAVVKKIAQSYDGKPRPPFEDFWTALKAIWPDIPRDTALDALHDYAPQLKRQRGETSNTIKSRK
jgi:hypothetical protein